MLKINRLNLQVVCESLLLLAVTLGILAYFSRKALRQEAMRNAEQILEATVQDIDNILMSVEQSTGNIYYDLVEHLDNPDRMYTYCRELVDGNPNIVGCAIAFKPGFYPGKDLFMAYVHRKASGTYGKTELVTSETFANRPYTEQIWFSNPMETGKICWVGPLKGADTEDEPLVTFCLPFSDAHNERIGVIAVDVSIHQLSKIILAAKPSENGYSVLLADNGSYIVHPDKEKLWNAAVFSQTDSDADPNEIEAAKAMLTGEKGMRKFSRDNRDWCVFYKPFERVERSKRSNEDVGWSVGVVYPEKDVFGSHNTLLLLVVIIAIVSLLLFFPLSSWIIRRQLNPLKQLFHSAQHITEGNYNEVLPYTDRIDEVGELYNRFAQMQRSLQLQVEELEGEKSQLNQQGNMLRAAYEKTVEADKMKTSFLRYMSNQMATPTEGIDNNVTALCNNYNDISKQEIDNHVENIRQKSQTIVELLNLLAHFSETESGKEADHV